MKKTCFTLLVLLFFFSLFTSAQDVNYDENKIGAYTLPDPLTFVNGKRVKTIQDCKQRRLEILDIFQREMYGQMPPKPETLVLETIEEANLPTLATLLPFLSINSEPPKSILSAEKGLNAPKIFFEYNSL